MRRLVRSDAGDTLVEILLAVLIMGIAAVAILTAFETSISTSALHRKQATASALVRDLGDYIAGQATYQAACDPAGAATAYRSAATAAVTVPSGYVATVSSVKYWDGSNGFVTACPGGTDPGFQRIDVEVDSTDGQATESLQIGKRQ